MIEFLISIDKQLFYFINKNLSNSFFDLIMPIITNEIYWFPIYIVLFIYLIFFRHVKINNLSRKLISFKNIIKENKLGLIIALLLAIGVFLADQISAGIIKNYVGRLRPCWELEDINLLVRCGIGKSFPSAHAANNFFAATFLSYIFKRHKYTLFIIAFLVAISRVFVGVHYPLDIICGAFLGIIIGIIMIYLFNNISKKYNINKY
jgi:undecaprenyl-diphosphatase